MSPRSERRDAARTRPAPQRYLYRVYGLTVESELELPELVPVAPQDPDVRIRFGSIPETLENQIGQWSWCKASGSEFVFTIEGVARYHIAGGETITIERRLDLPKSVSPADIRLWLLGSAFGAAIHQRGQLPLHVSAVKTPTGVWAFTGASGEGKSTLAGFLHARLGWNLMSDDVSVIDQGAVDPIIHPGPKRLKLHGDAIRRLGFNEFSSVRDLSNTDKFQFALPDDSLYEPAKLCALVVLESVADDKMASIARLKGTQAFDACLSAVFRPYMQCWFKLPQKRLEELAILCQRIKVYRFRRPRSLPNLDRHIEPLVDEVMQNSVNGKYCDD